MGGIEVHRLSVKGNGLSGTTVCDHRPMPGLATAWRGFVLAAWLAAGCAKVGPPPGPPRLPTVPAAGVVRHRGQPLVKASLVFHREDGLASALAKTDESGGFTLGTYAAADGAPAGGYRVSVAISTTTEIEPGVLAPLPEGGVRSLIPQRYADPSTSGLKVTIPEAGNRDIQIEIE